MSFLQDYMQARAMASSPEYAEDYRNKQRTEYVSNLMGKAGAPALDERTDPNTGEVFPAVEAVQGSGVLGGDMDPNELSMRMLMAPTEDTRDVGKFLTKENLDPNAAMTFKNYQGLDPQTQALYDQYKKNQFASADHRTRTIKDYQYRESLNPAQRKEFDEVQRRQQYISTGTEYVNPRRLDDPGIKIENQIAAQQKAYGGAEGIADSDAVESYPKALNTGDQTLGMINDLRNHPGLESGTGASSYAPVIRGTDRANFDALKDQVLSGAFLTAFQELKGGGHITEIEGEKATEAIARMQDAQSKEAFLKALGDYEAIVINALDVASTRYNKALENLNISAPANAGVVNRAPTKDNARRDELRKKYNIGQ